MAVNSLEFCWSGSGVAAAGASLGGIISTYAISGQFASGFADMAGVSFVDSAGPIGDGTLTYTLSTTSLQWTAPGGSIGAAVDVSAGGRFTLNSSGKNRYLIVDAVAAALPVADTVATITVRDLPNLLFDDAGAAATSTEYLCLYAYAVEAITALKVGVTQPNGVGSMAIGADPIGIDGTATTITNKTTAPNGVTFAVEDITIGDLTAGQYAAFWLRRVAGGASQGATANAGLVATFT